MSKKKEENYKWRTGRHCVFKNYVHLVFVTKYRQGVFSKEMITCLENIFRETCLQMGCELLEFGGEDDHVHLMVNYPPKIALSNLVGKLKGKSSYLLRKTYWEDIKNKLWGKHLWSNSYCTVTCGGAPLETIKKYIENQKIPPSQKSVQQSIQEAGRVGSKSRVRSGWTPP